MKHLIILAVFSLSSLLVQADCLEVGTYYWPYGKTINKNSILIISTGDTDLVSALINRYSLYLKSKTSKIQLFINQVCIGQNFTQLILKPKTELINEQEYELIYETFPGRRTQMKRWDNNLQVYILVKWKVLNHFDNESPIWTKAPTITGKFYMLYGCGPAEQVYFNFDFADKSDVKIKAVVTNVKTHKETIGYISQNNKTFELGHNMCYGEFSYDAEKEYTVTFYLIDESGNISLPSKTINFSRPDKAGWSN